MINKSKVLNSLPKSEERYIFDTVSIAKNEIGNNLLGIYLFGSASYNEYVVGESDLDIQAVIKSKTDEQVLGVLVEKLLHKVHPCPATKLEFVVYESESLLSERSIAYSLNLNTGRTISDHISFDSQEDAPHWFVLDIAMGETNAIKLYGAEPCDVFPKISDQRVAKAMLECLDWFTENLPSSEAHILCIYRCYAFFESGELVSKRRAKALVEDKLGLEYLSNEAEIQSLQKRTIEGLKLYVP